MSKILGTCTCLGTGRPWLASWRAPRKARFPCALHDRAPGHKLTEAAPPAAPSKPLAKPGGPIAPPAATEPEPEGPPPEEPEDEPEEVPEHDGAPFVACPLPGMPVLPMLTVRHGVDQPRDPKTGHWVYTGRSCEPKRRRGGARKKGSKAPLDPAGGIRLSCQVNIRLTPQEKVDIMHLAQSDDMSYQKFIRKLLREVLYGVGQ